MRGLIALVLGVLIGAAGFHVWYLRMDAPARCGWDHPFDGDGRAACRAAATRRGYGDDARRALDDLIGTVAR